MRHLAKLAVLTALCIAPVKSTQSQGLGPQTPRDITKVEGRNPSQFAIAPASSKLNLCNIHFHSGAEHRGPGFLHVAGAAAKHATAGHSAPASNAGHATSTTDHGSGPLGYQCNDTSKLTANELQTPAGNVCGGLKAGDTIEVHWVHTSCATPPGETLGSCVPKHCNNPTLRVEAQVFLVVNNRKDLDFRKFDYAGPTPGGFHRALALPDGGKPVVFRGSTTGPAAANGSGYEATWSVRPQCARVDINSLQEWCKSNAFKENHAHGVRALVTDLSQLSMIGASEGGRVQIEGVDGDRRLVRRYCGGGERSYRDPTSGKCVFK